MSFGINTSIPAAGNDPADDQPLIKQNFQNISDYLTVDHVKPGNAKNGFHKQITFASYNVPGAEVDPESTAYTNVGIADPLHPEYWWKNSQGIFPLSAIRAFGLIDLAPPAVTLVSGINIGVPSYALIGITHRVTIPITPGAVTGTSPSVFVIPQFGFVFAFNYTLNTLTVDFVSTAFISPTLFSVLVLQI